MDDDGLGDYRLLLVGEGTERTHSNATGKLPSERESVGFHLLTMVESSANGLICFPTPSASAMSLREAIDSGERAIEISRRLAYSEVGSSSGPTNYIGAGQISELIDCIQKSMVCATFSYLALEVFCNEHIALNPSELIAVVRSGRDRKQVVKLPAKKLERESSTEEKLSVVLPQLLSIQSPKGLEVWEDHRLLQRARNDTVHLKSVVSRPIGINKPELALFYTFLSQDVLLFPRAAVNMMLHFTPKENVPRWMEEPIARLNIKIQ